MADWITPRVWVVREAITATKLNEISESLNFLFKTARSIVTQFGGGTNLTSTNTSFAAVDDAQFTLSIDVPEGADVLCWFNAAAQHSLTTGSAIFDVLIDDTNYVSSGTGTPATTGCFPQRSIQGTSAAYVGGNLIIEGLSAGVHTFKLRWKVITAGTITLFLSGSYNQFGVRVG